MKTTERVKEHLSTCDLARTKTNQVAHALHTSSSTLRRRLSRDGTSFQALVDAERMRRCSEQLQDNRDTRGKQLAEICGYADHNSFFRAFQRWYGTGFLEYRRENFA